MVCSAELASCMDFGHGLDFEEAMFNRFGKRINGSSFILLATFRRYLFRLTEDSVSLALQSCLGGRAEDFQVKYLSQNHFSFTVSCKPVGFAVYELRRFIGKSFDVYFHLWNNGVPHWEREKRLWEEEEFKSWTKVLSKSQKKTEKAKAKKSVSFAKKIIQSSPKAKSRPQEEQSILVVGSFEINLAQMGLIQNKSRPGILLKSSSPDCSASLSNLDASFENCLSKQRGLEIHRDMVVENVHQHQFERSGTQVSKLNLNSVHQKSFVGNGAIDDARHLGLCFRCFSINHKAINCTSAVRCAACFNYGHKYKWCITRGKPKIYWRPKLTQSPGNEEAPANSTNPPLTERILSNLEDDGIPIASEGPPITLELQLPTAERSIVLANQSQHSFQSDSQVTELANMLGLHQSFGPVPSVEMLLADITKMGLHMHMVLPMKGPAMMPLQMMVPVNNDTWEMCTDNPAWGNNAEASCSYLSPMDKRSEAMPALQLMPVAESHATETVGNISGSANHTHSVVPGVVRSENEGVLVPYDENFAVKQIMENLHPGFRVHLAMETNDAGVENTAEMVIDEDAQNSEEELSAASLSIITPKKKRRTAKASTPIVDDEVRRSARLRKEFSENFIQLDNEPRRRKGEAKKIARISTVQDLKRSITSGQICLPTEAEEVEPIATSQSMEATEVEPIDPSLLVELGIDFCGVPPGELTVADLHEEDND